MESKERRWRPLKIGLLQGFALAPALFNIYTNDLPEFQHVRRFIYADDLCLAAQSNNINEIEKQLPEALT